MTPKLPVVSGLNCIKERAGMEPHACQCNDPKRAGMEPHACQCNDPKRAGMEPRPYKSQV